MVELNERIEHFRKMANDDPQNELGHFSLGKACLDAGRLDEAVGCFEKVIELKPDFSKAYQHLGEAHQAAGRTAQAVSMLTEGFKVAAARGDNIPRENMGRLLKDLGAAPPEHSSPAPAAPAEVSEHSVQCCRCGRVAPKLPHPPLKSELGNNIAANVCQPCWQEWMAMGTKVINELRLDFSNPDAGEVFDAHMKEFLQLPE